MANAKLFRSRLISSIRVENTFFTRKILTLKSSNLTLHYYVPKENYDFFLFQINIIAYARRSSLPKLVSH